MATQSKKPFIHRIVSSGFFWVIFWSLSFGFPLLRALNRDLPKPLPVYGELPSFELLTEDNLVFKRSDIKKKVTIAQFVFLNCPTVCKKNLNLMKKIQKRVKGLGTKVSLLSFTVDPLNDNPKRMFQEARSLKANPFVWKFITGEESNIKSLLTEGFKVPVGDKTYSKNIYDIAHSEKFVLIDQDANIRGYYGNKKDDINKLMIDVGLLVNQAFNN